MPGQPRPGDPPQLGGWGAEAPGREKRVFLPEGARVHCSRGPGGLTWADSGRMARWWGRGPSAGMGNDAPPTTPPKVPARGTRPCHLDRGRSPLPREGGKDAHRRQQSSRSPQTPHRMRKAVGVPGCPGAWGEPGGFGGTLWTRREPRSQSSCVLGRTGRHGSSGRLRMGQRAQCRAPRP